MGSKVVPEKKKKRIYREVLEGRAHSEIRERHNISQSTIYRCRLQGEREGWFKEEKKIKKPEKTADVDVEKSLLQEIEYLRWWKDGELRGFVDRLLRELSKNES